MMMVLPALGAGEQVRRGRILNRAHEKRRSGVALLHEVW